MIKFRENGEFISPKVEPEKTEAIDANIISSTIRGWVIFKLVIFKAMGITVEIVKREEPLKKLIIDENIKIRRGIRL